MNRSLARILTGTGIALMMAALLYIPLYGHSEWMLGDVFVGVGNGNFEVYNNAGGPPADPNLPAASPPNTGTTGACAFDGSLNAALVNTTQGKIFIRSASQNNAGVHTLLQTITTEDTFPQSIFFAANGDLFVGHLGGRIRRYTKDPNTPTYSATQQVHDAVVDTSDSFSFDIAADQKTIFYASGGPNIRKVTFDGSAFNNDELFMTLPQANQAAARALRVLPPTSGGGNAAILGGLLVANKLQVARVNASGVVIGNYDVTSQAAQNDWFALALDPRDVDQAGADLSFWAGDKTSGMLWKFNVQSALGNQPAAPIFGPVPTGGAGTLRGACVNGEPTSGQ